MNNASTFDALHRIVNGCIKDTIGKHGKINQQNYGSLGKRIASNLANNSQFAQLLRDRAQQAQAAAALYQVLGVLIYEAGLFDTDRGQLALTTASWLAGNRDEVPDFDSLLPFDVKEPR